MGSVYDSESEGRGLEVVRRLGLVVAVAYVALWWSTRAFPDVWDPFGARVAVASSVLAGLVGLSFSAWLRRRAHLVALGVAYLAAAHAIWLVGVNALHPRPVLGLFLLLAAFVATSHHTIRSEGQLRGFLAFTGVGVAAVVSLHGANHSARLPPSFVVMAVAALLTLAYVAVRAQLAMVEGLERVEGSLRADIARRERVEEALRTSQAQAQSLLRAIPDVLLRVTATGTLVAVSNPEGAPLAWTLDDRVGEPIVDVLPGIAAAFDAARTTRTAQTVDLTLSVRGASNGVEARLVPCGAEEVLVLVRDVTRERRAEQQVRLAERMVSIGTLASGIAHEVNNPLSYVMANLEVVRRALRERETDADLLQPLEESLEGAARIRDIVAQMREQVQEGSGAIGPVDVDEAARTAIRTTNHHLRYLTGVEVDLAAPGHALANGTWLVQVLVNLLMNAAQALPERPYEQNRITVRSRLEAGSVVLEVEDNGEGIPPEVLGRVFDPFFTTKQPGEGTGLGLYICHENVRRMGGRIDVTSRVGVGTKVRVVLRPCAHASTAPSPDPGVTPLARVRRLLVVDDEPQVGRALSRLLAPIEVVAVQDAEDGLRRCAEQDFEVVFCDMMMPGLDGIGFFERLAADDPDLARRVVFITGGVFTDRAREFLASHPGRCLEKPLDLDRVIEVADRIAHAP